MATNSRVTDTPPSPPSDDRVPRKGRLASAVVAQLRADILNGVFAEGAKLPTEPTLMERFGVSRTVVREAVAELRASGLVNVVQGAGIFAAQADRSIAIPDLSESTATIPRIIEMLEYRAGLECQAAMLAAARATSAETFAICDAHALVGTQVQQGLGAAHADRELHMAIAKAAHNPLLERALRHLGTQIIPRANLQSPAFRATEEYLAMIVGEHAAIVDAIVQRDPEAARSAMQLHLLHSQQRYEAFARSSSGAMSTPKTG